MDEDGSIQIIKKSKVRYQLCGPQKDSERENSSVDAISAPVGRQPVSKKK